MPVTDEPVHVRLRAIREALGLTQIEFLPVLNREAEALGQRAYSQSTLSKLESGAQAATFDDVLVFALSDPLGRGRLWLAWGDRDRDFTLRKAAVRDIPIDAMERVTSKKPAPRKRANDR